MTNKDKLKLFFVQCGNVCLSLHINLEEYDNKQDMYVELATRAVEIVFGSKEFEYDTDDYYAVMDSKGKNVLDGDSEELPDPTFTTLIYVLSSKKNNPHKVLTKLRTADIFANASQHENYLLALEAEKRENKRKDK